MEKAVLSDVLGIRRNCLPFYCSLFYECWGLESERDGPVWFQQKVYSVGWIHKRDDAQATQLDIRNSFPFTLYFLDNIIKSVYPPYNLLIKCVDYKENVLLVGI